MGQSYPKDRFDEAPRDLKRVGAHRAPAKRRGWIGFVVAAVITLLLVAIGAVAINVLSDRVQFTDTPVASGTAPAIEVPTAAPTIDPNAEIVVLNGTKTAGLAATAISQLNAAGWEQSITPSNSTSTDVETTIVYYRDSAQEGVARGLAQALGGATIQLLTETEAPDAGAEGEATTITIVLGTDYTPTTTAP
jgi:membrane-associated protease RseP (regulator of RpoE activity)